MTNERVDESSDWAPPEPALLEWIDAEIEHYTNLVMMHEALGCAHLAEEIRRFRTAHLYLTAIRNLVAKQWENTKMIGTSEWNPTLLEWIDEELAHYETLERMCRGPGHPHTAEDFLGGHAVARAKLTALRKMVVEQQAKETRMKKLKLWSLWVLALARFDTQRAKQLADEITNLQKGKPPMNHTNLGG